MRRIGRVGRCSRSPRPTEAGTIALFAALAAVVVSAALAGAVAEITRVEIVVARHRRTAAIALAAADTCLARIVGASPPGWDFGAALAGSDGVAGTADDGVLPAPAGCGATALPIAGDGAAERIMLAVDGRVTGGRRALSAVVGRDVAPGVAALLWLSAEPDGGAVTGTLSVDGVDGGDPTAAAVAGLAAPVDPAALDAWSAGPGVTSTAGTMLPLHAGAPPLDALVARVRAAGPAGAGVLVPGVPPGPSLALVDGDLTIGTTLRGAGLLVVDGVLDVQGSLDFAGAVVATRGVRVAAGARLGVDGVLWLGTDGAGPPLRVAGTLTLRQSRAAVTAADGLVRLPRPAVLLGLRDTG